MERLQSILVALDENFHPQIVERFGLRYIDQVVGQKAQDLASLVRPEIAGIAATEFGEYVCQTIQESLFIMPDREDQMIARWGMLSAGATQHETISPIVKIFGIQ